SPLVKIDIVNGKPAVTSLQIAEVFGKEHQNVLVDIRNILESDDFTALNFQASEYHDSTGRSLPMFILSRDGFLMVALAYTGYKARALRKAYIIKFSEMEAALASQTHLALPTDYATALRALADSVEQKALVEAKLALAAPKAEVYDTVVADKILTLYHFARKLTGVNCQNIKWRLMELGYLYKTTNLPYKVRSEFRGVLFDEKIVDGANNIVVLDKGKKELTRLYREGKLNMRRGHAA
ncbi:MAG: Rha family transcriptional regulator, partial [Bilophila sp.]